MSTEGNIKIDGFFFNASNVAQNGWKGG